MVTLQVDVMSIGKVEEEPWPASVNGCMHNSLQDCACSMFYRHFSALSSISTNFTALCYLLMYKFCLVIENLFRYTIKVFVVVCPDEYVYFICWTSTCCVNHAISACCISHRDHRAPCLSPYQLRQAVSSHKLL